MSRVIYAFALAVGSLVASIPPATAAAWDAIVAAARGQTVYWNGWGGKNEINDYMAWAGERVRELHGVTVVHTKLTSTSEAVTRIVAEKQAGRVTDGSVDLLWANGENFARLLGAGLLHGPWTQALPNYALVDLTIPSNTVDFGTPVNGMELPYGLFQINFAYDSVRLPGPPRSAAALATWAATSPGRFTYPNPQNFIGHTFLKQLLYELAPDPAALQLPVDTVDLAGVTAPLWAYLDRLHPSLWRGGRLFPENETVQRQLLADGEIDISISFGAGETSAAIAQGLVPPTTRTYALERGTIGNTSFLSIPFNARAKDGAMVLANFLLSPEAQARKQDPRVWGATTVLDIAKLAPAERALFESLPAGVATLTREQLGTPLPEPHFSWTPKLQAAWLERYQR
jgi:putative thiamine transport system substrate-binding protein